MNHGRNIFGIWALAMGLFLMCGMGGCADLASFTANTATYLSSATPAQATTLQEAVTAADLVTRLTKTAVDTNRLDRGTLVELQALRAGVRAALDTLIAADAAGHALDMSAFNAALEAWRAYATQKGIGT